MKHLEIFKNQLDLIKDENLRQLLEKQLNNIPEYFYHAPASSTGHYHSLEENCKGGLVRHVKAVFKLANDLLSLEMFKPLEKDRDLVLVAALLHDSLKMGLKEQKYTVFEHPMLAADSFYELAKSLNYSDMDSVNKICAMIASHSGQWNTSRYSKAKLPKPKEKIESFLHLCDYLGSRKYITINDLDEIS